MSKIRITLCAKCLEWGFFSSVRPPAFNYNEPHLCPECWQSWNTFTINGKGNGMSFLTAFYEWLGRIWDVNNPYGKNQKVKPERVVFT